MRRQVADNWQILMSKACCIKQKRLEAVKVLAKYLFKGMNTYAMYLFAFVIFNKCTMKFDNFVFALSIWCMECRLM